MEQGGDRMMTEQNQNQLTVKELADIIRTFPDQDHPLIKRPFIEDERPKRPFGNPFDLNDSSRVEKKGLNKAETIKE